MSPAVDLPPNDQILVLEMSNCIIKTTVMLRKVINNVNIAAIAKLEHTVHHATCVE